MAGKLTTINASHILLVEGEADRGFFDQVCKSVGLNPVIKVALPKDAENYYRNGKPNALKLLADLLIELLDESAFAKCLAVVVDADYGDEKKSGYQKTIEEINEIAQKHGFNFDENQKNGIVFKHTDGNAEFGVWIMPNNQDEGMLEDFIKNGIATSEQALFGHAAQTVANITEPKFKPHHFTKAEVATWLAWQKDPGHGLYASIKDSLLDENGDLFKQLSAWLRHIFPVI